MMPRHSTLGCEIGQVRRQRTRWPDAGVTVVLLALGIVFLQGPALSAGMSGALVAGVLVATAMAWRAGRIREQGRLVVSAAGRADWLPETPGRNDTTGATQVVPQRWHLGADEIWLLASDERGVTLHLRLDRTACSASEWRAARRWLVWTGRAPQMVLRA